MFIFFKIHETHPKILEKDRKTFYLFINRLLITKMTLFSEYVNFET